MEMHERLAQARRLAQYATARDAAEALGLPYPTYAGHENGTSGFRADKGEIYARKFKVRFEWLMRGTGPMTDLATKYREILSAFDSLPAGLQASYADILRKLAEPHQRQEPPKERLPAEAKSPLPRSTEREGSRGAHMHPSDRGEDGKLAALRAAIERLSTRRFAKEIALAEEFEVDAVGCGSEAADVFTDSSGVRLHFATNMAKDFTVRWAWDLLEMRIHDDTGWFFANGKALVGRSGIEAAYPFRMSGVLGWRNGDWHWRLLHASEPVG